MKLKWLLLGILLFSSGFAAWEIKDIRIPGMLAVSDVASDGSKYLALVDTDGSLTTTWDWEIYLVETDGPATTRLTDNAVPELYPKISGNIIAYLKVCGDPNMARCTAVVFTDLNGTVRASKNFPNMIFQYGKLRLGLSGHRALLIGKMAAGSGTYRAATVTEVGDVEMAQILPKEFGSFSGRWIRGDISGNYGIFISGHGLVEVFVDSAGEIRTKTVAYLNEDEEVGDLSIASTGRFAAILLGSSNSAKRGLFVGNLNEELHKISVPIEDPVNMTSVLLTKNGQKLFVSGFDGRDTVVYLIDLTTGRTEEVYRAENPAEGQWNWIRVRLYATDERGSVVAMKVEKGQYDRWGSWKIAKKGGFSYSAPEILLGSIRPGIGGKTAVEFSSVSTEPGRSVLVPVKLYNGKDIGSISLLLKTPNYTEIKRIVKGPLVENALFDYNLLGNEVRVGIVDTAGINGNGTLFYVELFVENISTNVQQAVGSAAQSAGTTAGTSGPFGISGKISSSSVFRAMQGIKKQLVITEGELSDTTGSTLDAVYISGNLILLGNGTVQLLKGDVDGNGVITSNDALLALKIATGKMNYTAVADMDENGKITAKDALEILKLANNALAERVASMGGKVLPKRPGIPGRRW